MSARGTEICADCGKPIRMNEPSYYRRDPCGGDFGQTFHSACGDAFGIKAMIAAERERCAKIAETCSVRHSSEHVDRESSQIALARADIAASIRAKNPSAAP